MPRAAGGGQSLRSHDVVAGGPGREATQRWAPLGRGPGRTKALALPADSPTRGRLAGQAGPDARAWAVRRGTLPVRFPLTVRLADPPGHVMRTNSCCFFGLNLPPRNALLPVHPLPAR
jgi:hypothetical protein